MGSVNVRDLRNHGGDVLDRVAAGETVVVVRSGREVAELRPIAGPAASAAELIRRRARLPDVDPGRLRDDVDASVDPSL